MKISTKLISSFSGVIILLLLIGLASQYFNKKIKNKVIEESRGAVKELEITGELESYLYQSFIDAQYYLDMPYRAKLDESLQDSLISVSNIKRRVRISMQGLNLKLKKTRRLLEQKDQTTFFSPGQIKNNEAIIAKLTKGIVFYNSLMDQLLSFDDNNFRSARHLLATTIEPHYRNNLLPLVEHFRVQIRSNLNYQVILLNHRLTKYSNILLIITLIAFAFSLIFAYMLYRSIANPLYLLAQAVEEVGRGNLKKRIVVKSDDEIGQLGEAFNQMAENLNKITFSKEYVDDIIGSMRDSLIVTDVRLHITKVNTATLNMLGYNESELIGAHMEKVFAKMEDKSLLRVNDHEGFENHETRFCLKRGKSLPVNLSKAIIRDNEENVQSLVYVASDITERKKSEKMIKTSLKEKETLLSEIHHRVKNNLAVISGLLQMQRWESENEAAQEALQDSQLRVKSIALVHEKLYQSENLSSIKFDRYVEELVKGINKTFKNANTDITFEIDIEPLTFSINQAIPCSLLLNELIVNVHKHAFKNVKKGEVVIKLWEEGEKVHLMVKDNGTGLEEFSENKSRQSLGMSLLNTLIKQLGGELNAFNDNGATFLISFRLDEL